jgi:hypothetical protein
MDGDFAVLKKTDQCNRIQDQSLACDNGRATCSRDLRSEATPQTACTAAASSINAAPIR